VSDPKFVFMTRIRDVAFNVCVCEAYKGNAPLRNVADNVAMWREVFRGTREECENYTANLHHSIDPKMVEKFNPHKDVRRLIQ
jgi:hypothetical protein